MPNVERSKRKWIKKRISANKKKRKEKRKKNKWKRQKKQCFEKTGKWLRDEGTFHLKSYSISATILLLFIVLSSFFSEFISIDKFRLRTPSNKIKTMRIKFQSFQSTYCFKHLFYFRMKCSNSNWIELKYNKLYAVIL